MKKHAITIILALLLAVLAGCGVYLSDYYPADIPAIEAFSAQNDNISVTYGDNQAVFRPENPVAGLIFYPGGKVEYTAYAPLMSACAEQGILCVLVKMPFNLAVFDSDRAAELPRQYPEIDTWYIGGHSLGGSMAAAYLSDCPEDFAGLVLLASYSTRDLSGTDLRVLSLYGSEDGVLNMEKYRQYRKNLPSDLTETVIPGGNHACFGMYGRQEGDGAPKITNSRQIDFTAGRIADFMGTQ